MRYVILSTCSMVPQRTALLSPPIRGLCGEERRQFVKTPIVCRCHVSAAGVCKRDEMVFAAALEAGVPICMALSGGYAKNSASVISQCLSHIFTKFKLIQRSSKL